MSAGSLRPPPGRRSRQPRPVPAAPKELQVLVDGALTAMLESPALWDAWLRVLGRLPRFSAINALLIARRCPHASRVAPVAAWQRLGREPLARAVPIPLLTPVRRGRSSVTAYRVTRVFDRRSTMGDALPDDALHWLARQPAETRFTALQRAAGGAGVFLTLAPTANLGEAVEADVVSARRLVRVRVSLASSDRLRVAVPALADLLAEDFPSPPALLEWDAVCGALAAAVAVDHAIDPGLLGAWCRTQPAPLAGLRRSLTRIQQVVAPLLRALAALLDPIPTSLTAPPEELAA